MLPSWSTSIIYQIFPRSFYDSNHDGIGDLPGIIQKLDYLQNLGVNILWLNPIYPSGGIDAGYDVIDHTAIDPAYGKMSDLDELIRQAHQKKMQIMLDFLPNHTSDQHSWFIESSLSLQSHKRDWYIWHNPSADGGPPNNWKSVFGGSAWTFDVTTKQYYLHTFYPQQPDLNLLNPNVRAALRSILKFYLSRGVDAFRVDAASHFIKDSQFRDNPLRADWQQITDPYEQQDHLYDKNLPQRLDLLNEFASVLDQYPQTFMVSESYLTYAQLKAVHTYTLPHNHTACNFMLMDPPTQSKDLVTKINQYLAMCHKTHTTPTWILGNHDRTRISSKYGLMLARQLACLQLTLPGLAFIYYGEEIGMTSTDIPPEARHDTYQFQLRDGQRTPMQWSSQDNAGFSQTPPWIHINPEYSKLNVENQLHSQDSTLSMYQHLISIRRQFKTNEISLVTINQMIQLDRSPYRVLLNLSAKTISLTDPVTPIFTTYQDKKGEAINELRPFESIIFGLS